MALCRKQRLACLLDLRSLMGSRPISAAWPREWSVELASLVRGLVRVVFLASRSNIKPSPNSKPTVHKSNIGDGSEGQSLVAGLTTAAAIWCSAAVGVASAVGLYCVSTTATFATICVLKYARVPKQEEEPRFPKPRPLDIINDEDRRPLSATARTRASVDGLFGRDYSNSRTIEPYPTSKKSLPQPQEIPSVLLDPRLEHVLSRLLQDEPPIRIEEEQVVVKNTRDNIKKDMEP